ncbi:MAG: NAD(P)H-hydrate dehydratase [Bacteroidales bacterium]|nr:NAD(P)H-hydrate dehydratase [Bacteroidales bacterium]
MKVLSTEQIRQADQYTIQNEPISSVDLMERAATKAFEWLMPRIGNDDKISIFCGMGNNGGDGLVLARLFYCKGITSKVFMVRYSEKMSLDCEANYKRLKEETKVPILDIRSKDDFPAISENEIIIDAIFGSGLNRPIEGMAGDLIEYLNDQNAINIAIDIASGLIADAPCTNNVIFQADYTLTFQTPKLAFLMPENDIYTGQLEILDIQLHPKFLDEVTTINLLIDKKMVLNMLHPRMKFSHKGTYGHALLIAGSEGKTGAAILGAKSCLRTGVGLLSVKLPQSAWTPLQTAVPEAMIHVDDKLDAFNAIGIGPGLGKAEETQRALKCLIQECHVPLVMDADALNILSENKTWLAFLPAKTILTPHPKEFARLFGETDTSFERLELQREMAKKYDIIIVLKGANTSTALPNGTVFFNSTGNPGMATAGSGDVLTGMILSLLAQRYEPEEAAVLGVFLHGLAGDLAAEELSQEAMIASDITEHIGKAYLTLQQS